MITQETEALQTPEESYVDKRDPLSSNENYETGQFPETVLKDKEEGENVTEQQSEQQSEQPCAKSDTATDPILGV